MKKTLSGVIGCLALSLMMITASCSNGKKYQVQLSNGTQVLATDGWDRKYTVNDKVCVQQLVSAGQPGWYINATGVMVDSDAVLSTGAARVWRVGKIVRTEM